MESKKQEYKNGEIVDYEKLQKNLNSGLEQYICKIILVLDFFVT